MRDIPKLRLLTFSTLYPSSSRPRHGIFVETRLTQLVSTGHVEAEVVAPVPWFPFRGRRFGVYADMANTPREEMRHGLRVHHPRYIAIPKIGSRVHPSTLAWAAKRRIEGLIEQGLTFDAIDAHYFYPDGVAAASLARHFSRPFVVTARGSDINLIAHLDGPRRMILQAARQAHAVIAVSRALADAMIRLGIDPKRIAVLRNGVDCSTFALQERAAARSELCIGHSRVLLSVGNLVQEKGHDLLITALGRLPDACLIIVGGGPERTRLLALARRLELADRVQILEPMPQRRLAALYSAADVLLLASSREGWPNVLLESMACGTPVVATDVGGVREIVSTPSVGEVVSDRSIDSMVAAVKRLLSRTSDRYLIRQYAEQFSWDAISRGQLEIFQTLRAARA